MLRKKSLLIVLFTSFVAFAQNTNQAYLNYIQKYADLAIAEQQKYGIPASITLAQGLLESGAGQSQLAAKSNNHFGIKCHNDWKGAKVYHDDDQKGECFRQYDKVSESYNDHSLFLVNRQRYASLFKLKSTDYKSWAHGLKQAGYATDPGYAAKLIKIIEDYNLHQFDVQTKKTETTKNADKKSSQKPTIQATQPTKNEPSSMGSVELHTRHKIARNNGVRYVTAAAGDSFESIAYEFGIREKRLRQINDATEKTVLQAGEKVYLHTKRNRASRKTPTHRVKEGESARSIAQKYGIKMTKIYDINGLRYDQGVRINQLLQLR